MGFLKMSTTIHFMIPAIIWPILNGMVVSSDKCQSPQYLQLGKKGTISCNYPVDLYAAVWFNSTSVTSNDRPFISLTEGIVSGPGHESGEYGVQPNGSLIINKVSTKHNHVYRVTTLATIDEDPIFEDVRVVVYDKPQEPYPTIDATGCDQKSLCFLDLNAASSLSCNVLRVGEVLDDLSWKLRTNTGDGQISSQSKNVTTSVNELQSYHSVVDISLQTSLSLRLYVCVARSNVSEVGNNESTILVESGKLEASSEQLLVTPNERVIMNCGEDVSFFVWKKVGQTEEIIAFGTKGMSEVMMPDGFTLQDSSLIINTVGNPTLGTYTCVYSTDGVATKFTSTDVTFQDVIFQEEERRTGWDVVVVVAVVVLFVMTSCIVVLLIVAYHNLSSSRRSSIRSRIRRSSRRIRRLIDRQSTTVATQQQQHQLLKPTKKVTEEELKALCKKVIISKDQTRDVHDGTVKRLKEASERQVDIQRIVLRDSFISVDDKGEAINLSSGAVLPPLNTLKCLDFENEKWQQWDLTKLISILQYACHRSPPTEINIERSLLPFKFENKLSTLQQKPRVEWQTGDVSAGILHLNYDTEQWENTTDGPLNAYVYTMLLKKFEKEKANEEVTEQTEGAKLLEDSDHKQSHFDVIV
ncbi:uncharacterized protein [Apostichopus japonicus]|uniref:uncharacterized protein isoform X3 n=1 Tax=Stichopus japonicus TaxID=307972 RepID=UPI003AB4FCAA